MSKKYLLSLFGLILFVWTTFAAQITIQPQFSDARFQPDDKLHAWCINKAVVQLKSTDNEKISSFRLIISYEPQNIEIIGIKPNNEYKDILDSKIEYDKIIVSLLNKQIPSGNSDLFTLSFKSNTYASWSLLSIHKPSYLIWWKDNKEIPVFVEQKLSFEQVPECDPDILPPTISLVKPSNTSLPLGVDSYFTFSFEDEGKGINKNSLNITFDWKTYSGTSDAFIRDKNTVSFLPEKRLPVWKNLDLIVSIADKQSYGWPNSSTKTFNFTTHSSIVFENTITPTMYRNLANKAKAIYATSEECAALSFLGINASSLNFPFDPLESLSKKINCPFDKETISKAIEKNKEATKSSLFISVFAILGWILFAITFVLKLHYIASYKKHKKIVKSLKSSQSKL